MYKGTLVAGKKNGYGKQTYKNGRVYEGFWKDNKPNGFGKSLGPMGTNMKDSLRMICGMASELTSSRMVLDTLGLGVEAKCMEKDTALTQMEKVILVNLPITFLLVKVNRYFLTESFTPVSIRTVPGTVKDYKFGPTESSIGVPL